MARLVSEGRKREFVAFGFTEKEVPDPEAAETFVRSKLNWDEVGEGKHSEMLNWYRSLIQLRRKLPALNDGDRGHLSVNFDEQRCWLDISRPGLGRGDVRILANLGTKDARFDLADGYRVELASSSRIAVETDAITLQPDTLAILLNESG